MAAIGKSDGVYFGNYGDPLSFRKVLALQDVSQIAVIETYGLFVVLADGHLIAYFIDSLVPPSDQSAFVAQPPQKLSAKTNISFFLCGISQGCTLVVFARPSKSGINTIFKALEPTRAERQRRNIFGSHNTMFKTYKVRTRLFESTDFEVRSG